MLTHETKKRLIDQEHTENLYQAFLQLEKILDKDKPVIRYTEGRKVISITAEQYMSDVRRIANTLWKKNLQGKKVALMGHNTYEWIAVCSAMHYVGTVACLFSKDQTSEEIREYVERTGITGMIVDASLKEVVEQSSFDDAFEIMYTESMKDEREISSEFVSTMKGEDLSFIFYTSGTTGKNKAVMISSRAFMYDVTDPSCPVGIDYLLNLLPFHHLFGFSSIFNAIFTGSTVLIGDDPGKLFRYVKLMKADVVSVVPSLLSVVEQQLRKMGKEKLGLSSLKAICTGGAKSSPEILHTFWDNNIDVYQVYSCSETCGQGFMYKITPERPDALGTTYPHIEAGIIDGEIVFRGETIMMGYYDDEEETNSVLYDGWYHTGDLGYEAEDGFFYLTGRKKNLIILSNGENISPEEIEGKLSLCEDIKELLVKEKKDRIACEVYPAYEESDCEEEKAELRQQITRFVDEYNDQAPTYKQIVYLEFREIPFEKTAIGKIKRN